MRFVIAAICGVTAYFLFPKEIMDIPLNLYTLPETARLIGAILIAGCGISLLLNPPQTRY